jgi:hypothetical protein
MNDTRRFAFLVVTAMMAVVLPCVAQDSAKPDLSGTGNAGHIAAWKTSTTLTNSVISQSGGSVGIGTTTPAATLEVNGNAQVDGNFSLSGSILENGVGQLLWAPNNESANLSVGLGALPATTTGTYNTAVGHNALPVNTSGAENTANGAQALFFNTTGGYNTAVGVEALDSNSTGSYNTAIGWAALANNGTGGQNTAFGWSALSNITGNNNIGIGYFAGLNISSADNNIEIGSVGTSTDSGTIRIGCTAICTAPLVPQTSTFIAGIYGSTTQSRNAVPVVIDSNGNLGTVSSSRRYKEDIQDMGEASDGLMQLRPVTFRYKKAFDDGSKPVQYGLIAEEVADVYPDLVARSADGQVEAVKYQLLDTMLLNELQKQHATIAAQKEHIQSQEQHIRSLEERLARVEAMLTAGTTGTAGQ